MIHVPPEPPLEPEWVRRPAPELDSNCRFFVMDVERDTDGSVGCRGERVCEGPWLEREAEKHVATHPGQGLEVVEDWPLAQRLQCEQREER